MLRESLQKKVSILSDIISMNEEQRSILEDPNASPDEFQTNIDAKDELVNEIVKLDEGFESIFSKVETEIKSHPGEYSGEIRQMQELIREITDFSERVRSQEKINSELAREKFSTIKSQIKKVRQSRTAVNHYYQSMTKANYYDPQFYDSKK
jgi:DNA repair exonuclease SbcCD ATPase subunit